MQQTHILAWCRRNWGKAIATVLAAFVLWTFLQVYFDRMQRGRFVTAASQVAPITNAVNEQFKKTGKFPSDLKPFVKQQRYAIEHSNLGRVGFSVEAQGQNLRVLFDSDQGPFSGKTFILEGTEKNGAPAWSCSVPGVPGHFLPASCR
jgi:hypothetical protein